MRLRGASLLVGLVVLLVAAGTAAADSPAKQRIDDLFWAVSAFAVVVFFVVLGILLWFLWRYRESVSPRREDHLEHHTGLEVAWTIVPIVILLLIIGMSWPVLQFTDTPPQPDTTVTAIAERFSWTFRYDDGTETIGEFWVRQNAIVRIETTSKDVIHSLAIPALGIRIDAVPGRVNSFWTQPTETGDYLVECVELCGIGHHSMHAVLHVFPESESRLYGPPPVPPSQTDVALRQFGGPNGTWSIEPATINATLGSRLTLRITNENPDAYEFAIDSPVDASVPVPAFGVSWLNVSIGFSSSDPVPYGPTDGTARANGMVGELNILSGTIVHIELWDDGGTLEIRPDPLVLPRGVPIVFHIHNNGTVAHNVVFGEPYGDVEFLDPIGAGDERITAPVTFSDDAGGLYWCAVPGHRQAGMIAPFEVGEGGGPAASSDVPVLEMIVITLAISIPAILVYTLRHARRGEEDAERASQD